jgi:CO/xanthine dehydrogenase Mo-binding subunit
VADLVLPGLLEMAVLRSPHAHARLARVNLAAAAAAPGVAAAISATDLGPALRTITPLVPHPGVPSPRGAWPLAHGVVRYAGEPVAAVLAANRYLAEDALEAIAVDYEPLPSAGHLEAAARAGAPRVHADLPDNVAGRWTVTTGDVDAALAGAAHVIRERFEIERGHGQPLEPRGVVARWDAVEETLTVWTSTQVPHRVRDAVAGALGLAARQVRVITPDVGGGFGLKAAVYPEEILAAWLSRATGRPVRWIEDRREHFLATIHDRLQIHDVEAAVDAGGRLIGLRHSIILDIGAYLVVGAVVGANVQIHLPGPYAVPNVRSDLTVVYTHRTPTGPWRGAGRPQANFVMERLMDRIAAAVGLDPVEIRRRNLVPPARMPYATGLALPDGGPVRYDSGDYPALLERVLALFGYERRQAERRAARAQGRAYGIGVCCSVEASAGGPYEGARVWIEPDGQVAVAVGNPAQGQGHVTTLSRLVGRELGVDPAQVRVTGGDTRLVEQGIGTFGSRATAIAGSAVLLAARELREKMLTLAARRLEAAAADLELAGGRVQVRGAPTSGVTFAQLVRAAFPRGGRAPFPGEPGISATHFFSPAGLAWSSGAAACAVEVDRETAAVRVLDYVAVHDSGALLSPALAEGQVIGAIANGLGNTLYERLVYDEQDQLLTTTYLDYALPTITEVPCIRLADLPHPSPLNPLGAKGVGESGIIAVASVVAQAVEDALAGSGARIRCLPILPETIAAWARAVRLP